MRTDYRISVDLSSMVKDARQLTYVFIDSYKIQTIHDLQMHIAELFCLKPEFYLTSKGKTYLPPKEDVRILEKDDIAIVVPGSAFSSNSPMISLNSSFHNILKKVRSSSNDDSTKDVPLVNSQNDNQVEEKVKNVSTTPNDQNAENALESNATLYHSVIDETMSIDGNDVKENGDKLENDTNEKNQSARKRIRRKKRSRSSVDSSVVDALDFATEKSNGKSETSKKLKIVKDVPGSSRKHIRFNTSDNEEFYQSILPQDESQAQKEELTPAKNLNTLLALRQTSTPMVFTAKKSQVKDDPQDKCPKTLDFCEGGKKDISNSVNRDPKIGDVIKFNMLKMDENYSPVVSDMITAEVVTYSTDSMQYGLKVINGRNEIEAPNGKFSLPTDEQPDNAPEEDILNLGRSMLMNLAFLKQVE